MSKKSRNNAKRLAAQVTNTSHEQALIDAYNAAPLSLGRFSVRPFTGLDTAFGAKIEDYPPMAEVPTVDRKFSDAVSALFFNGGRLEDHGLRLKAGIHRARALAAIRAWMGSFAPKHEHKTAVVAWAFSEWCEPTS